AAATGGTVTGVVFEDLNHNGVRDPGEPGIRNVRVFLDANGNGKLDHDGDDQDDDDGGRSNEVSTRTDANGNFTLHTTTNGTFTLGVIGAGLHVTGSPVTVTLTGGTTVTGVDIPITGRVPPGHVKHTAAGVIIGGLPHVQVFDETGKLISDTVA